MSRERQSLGALGERAAERFLRDRGWRVLERRFRSGHRDIDLVVERDGMVAFVEVKSRRGAQCGDPIEAVNWKKQRELVRSSSCWIERHGGMERGYRFDVVGVRFVGATIRIRHVEDAFRVAIRA